MKAAVAAALAISIFTAVNAQSAHDAPVRDAAVVKQLKKLNRAAAANQTELRQINNTLGVKGSVLEPNTAMDWLGDIERNTLNTCRAVAQYQYSECPDY